jgi:hypothetical protein
MTKFTRCNICQSDSKEIFKSLILKKYNVPYYECSKCGFIQTEKPHWLDEAYKSAINTCDTGLLARNQRFSETCSLLLYYFLGDNTAHLDYAGGYGVFTRLMRDIGFNFYWHDPYCQNLFAQGFEYKPESRNKIGLITAFEVFEHFTDPKTELEKMLLISRNILFSTDLIPQPRPKLADWWYYAPEHGQHISFYTRKSLEIIASMHNLHFYTDGKRLHLFSDKKLPLFGFSRLRFMKKLKLPFIFVKKYKKSLTVADMNILLQ